MQYQCFYLNPKFKLAHDEDAKVLFESDNLGECCQFIYDSFLKDGMDIAVYQPKSNAYRDYYRQPARAKNGQFVSR